MRRNEGVLFLNSKIKITERINSHGKLIYYLNLINLKNRKINSSSLRNEILLQKL